MSSRCIASCINDATAPGRLNYVSLHRWPESDVEFARSVASGNRGKGPRLVDSYSCRQMYLRSYTFSRKETMPERTRKCIVKVKERVVSSRKKRKVYCGSKKRCAFLLRKVKEMSCSALLIRLFNRVLSCAASVDVVDRKNLY